MDLTNVRNRLLQFENDLATNNNIEVNQEAFDIGEELKTLIEIGVNREESKEIQVMAKKLSSLINEYDLYVPDNELDRMFPNRYDNDFDEDDMSWNNVFGND